MPPDEIVVVFAQGWWLTVVTVASLLMVSVSRAERFPADVVPGRQDNGMHCPGRRLHRRSVVVDAPKVVPDTGNVSAPPTN